MVGRGFRRGFTLIELLVVIAIIAILAGILFPVFAKAREKAEQADCTSNVKQIATALIMYSQDYDQKLPPGSCKPAGGGWFTAGNYSWPYTTLAYTKNAQIFNCRAFPLDQTYDGGKLPKLDDTGVSYVLNRFNAAAMNVKITRVSYPAQTVLIADGTESTSNAPMAALTVDGTRMTGFVDVGTVPRLIQDVRANHNGDQIDPPGADTGFSIVGWVDGHAKATKLEALTTLGPGADGCKWAMRR